MEQPLIPNPLDAQTFQRVWERVMPDPSLSPVEPVEPHPPRQQPPAQQTPSACLGPESMASTDPLISLLRLERGLYQQYRRWERRCSGSLARTLSCLCADQRHKCKRLSVAYLLITGEQPAPGADCPPTPAQSALAFRALYLREQEMERAYLQALAGTDDPCLKSLYSELSELSLSHLADLRSLLERM